VGVVSNGVHDGRGVRPPHPMQEAHLKAEFATMPVSDRSSSHNNSSRPAWDTCPRQQPEGQQPVPDPSQHGLAVTYAILFVGTNE